MLSRVALRLATRSIARNTPISSRFLVAAPTSSYSLLRSRPISPSAWSRPFSDQKNDPSNKDAPPPESSSSPKSDPESSSSSPPKESEDQVPLHKLPDLTQGIPSTFEFESASKDPNALATTDDQSSTGGRKKGELPASAYVSSSERRRLRFAKYMYIFMFSAAIGSVVLLGRDWETEEEIRRHPDAPNGLSLGLWWKRFRARSTAWLTYYQDPSFDKLLPDPDPSFQRPYTLVLSLEDLLIHSDWSREHGWRIAKRPGVDYFLRYLSQYYEIVLFTSVPFAMGEPVVRKFDPYHFIMWPLFREATKYVDGEWIKDLSYLNRDLSKVIIIDTNPKHVSAQPENAIILEPWKGAPKDSELVGLIPFLEYLCTMGFPDVRRVLKSFEGKHIPTEFARREAIARRNYQKQMEKEHGTKHSAHSALTMLGNALGLKSGHLPGEEENPNEAFAKGKMLQDIARERGQKAYMQLEKQIKENGEKWLKEEQEMIEKAQKEAMSNMKESMWTWFKPGKGEEEKKK